MHTPLIGEDVTLASAALLASKRSSDGCHDVVRCKVCHDDVSVDRLSS